MEKGLISSMQKKYRRDFLAQQMIKTQNDYFEHGKTIQKKRSFLGCQKSGGFFSISRSGCWMHRNAKKLSISGMPKI